MRRECTRCQRSFTPADLARAESKGMESQRKAAGLEGVRFLYYRCPTCEKDDIFVDVLPRPDEPVETYRERREAMEDAARAMHSEQVEVVVNPVKQP
jgi:transcriptional regulator NrdR family protein